MPSNSLQKRLDANARWRAKYPEKAKAQQRKNSAQWRKAHPMSHILSCIKSRAKRDGIDFSVTRTDFPEVLPTHCPVLGLELHYSGYHEDGLKGPRSHSASVDRKDPNKGYVPGNVCIMSFRANSLIKDASLEELEAVVAYMRGTAG